MTGSLFLEDHVLAESFDGEIAVLNGVDIPIAAEDCGDLIPRLRPRAFGARHRFAIGCTDGDGRPVITLELERDASSAIWCRRTAGLAWVTRPFDSAAVRGKLGN